jgi:hypothetical protein
MGIYSDVEDALRLGTLKILEEEFPDTLVIFSHMNGAEPADPYVSIQLVTTEQIGRTQYSTFADEQENLHILVQYEVVAQFSFIGSTAGDMAFTFNQAVSNNVVMWEAFQKNNLAPLRKSVVRRVPVKRETNWVEYHNIDVTFSYAVKTVQPVDVVERVSFVDINTGETFVIPPLEPTP